MTTPVSFYGLHSDHESVYYLHQGRASNNFIGLRTTSPFSVSLRKSMPCPHLINQAAPIPDVAHWQQFSRWLYDPLLIAMLPVPRDRTALIPYFADPNNQLAMTLVILSRMSSPIYPVVKPLRSMTRAVILAELGLTNVCPLVLTNVQTEDNEYMFELAREARTLPRRLIFTGAAEVVVREPLLRLTTGLWDVDELAFAALPMEALGALLLRRFARYEPLHSEITKGTSNG